MGEIYRRAKGVVAHLGAPSIGDPRDALLSLVEWTKQFKDMIPLPEPKEGDDHYCPNWKLSPFSYFVAREFLTSVWFTRSWITQEFVLARDLVFLYGFGLNTAAWPWRVTVTIHLNLDDSPAKPPGFAGGRSEKEIKALFKASNQFSQWRSLKLRVDENPDGFNIIDVLKRTNLTDVTNPKDRIYSILGLLREADRIAICVDYGFEYSYHQLLIDVAAHCVRTGKTTEMFNCAEHVTENLNLLSWVPEWINQSSNGLAPMLYKASGDTNVEVILEEHDSILRIKGYIVDHFDYFGPGVTYPEGRLTGRWNVFASSHSVGAVIERAATIMCQQLFLIHSQYPTKECAREVVRWVITCDQGWSGERSTAADKEQYNSYLSNISILKEMDLPKSPQALDEYLFQEYRKCIGPLVGDTVLFLGSVLSVMGGNKLGVTKTGWLGVFPQKTGSEDVVVVFKGGNTPFVMREDGKGQFHIIGACYIHGIMDGELFDKDAGLYRWEEENAMEFVLC